MKAITLLADWAVGGYAWAKFGFCPKSEDEWKNLAHNVRKKLSAKGGNYAINYNKSKWPISKDEYEAIQMILAENSPDAIWHLLELQTPLGKSGGHMITTAKALLMGTSWEGKLSTSPDSEGWQRFQEYVQPQREASMAVGV